MDPLTLLGIGGTLLSSLFGSNNAASSINAGVDKASQFQQEQYAKSLEMLQPQIQAGNTARDTQLSLLGLGGSGGQDALKTLQASPDYQFRLNQGYGTLNQGRANSGTMQSGAAMKELQDYGQGFASNELGNLWNRLGGLSGAGSTATGAAVSAGTGTANNLSDLAYKGADANASASLTNSKTMNNGIKDLLSLYYSK